VQVLLDARRALVLHVVEAPRHDSLERHREREERMRDDGVAPVQDQLPTILHEHLSVMQVVVLEGLGHAVRRELLGHLADPRDGVPEPLLDFIGLDQRRSGRVTRRRSDAAASARRLAPSPGRCRGPVEDVVPALLPRPQMTSRSARPPSSISIQPFEVARDQARGRGPPPAAAPR
jgi:hypothetical protein